MGDEISDRCFDASDKLISINELLTSDMTKSEVIEKTDMPVHTVQITLSILELKGLISERGGKIIEFFDHIKILPDILCFLIYFLWFCSLLCIFSFVIVRVFLFGKSI